MAEMKTAVRKMSRRILIPTKPLRRGLKIKKLKMEISRKRNLFLKQASINGERNFLAMRTPHRNTENWSVGVLDFPVI
jgi:hypothetical protein